MYHDRGCTTFYRTLSYPFRYIPCFNCLLVLCVVSVSEVNNLLSRQMNLRSQSARRRSQSRGRSASRGARNASRGRSGSRGRGGAAAAGGRSRSNSQGRQQWRGVYYTV